MCRKMFYLILTLMLELTLTNVAMATDPDLIGWWKFDEESGDTANDASGNDYHGDRYGATWTAGKIGNALDFDGTDDYVDCGDIGDIDGATELSGAAWIKLDDLTGDNVILAKDSFITNTKLLFWRDETGFFSGRTDTLTIRLGSGSSSVAIEGTTDALSDNDWHHVAFTFVSSSSTGLRLYIDGTEDAQSPVSTSSISALGSSANSLLIGKPVTGTQYFDGLIDDVRIYSEELTLQEVQDLCSPPSSNLVSHWKFDEGSEWTAYDSAGSNHGARTGATWTTGILGGALDFDGSGDYVDTADISEIELNDSTITFWAKADSLTADLDIITKGPHNISQPLVIWRDELVGASADAGASNTDTISVIVYDGTTQHWIAAPSDTFNDNNWHHFAVVIDATNNSLSIYEGGTSVVSNTKTWNGIQNTATALRIGDANPPLNCFDGIIDDVRVYDEALSSQEIDDLCEEGGSSETPLPFSDDFIDGDYDGWTLVDQGTTYGPMSWSAATNVMIQSSNVYTPGGPAFLGTYAYLEGGSSWTDYKTTLTIKSSDDDAIGLMFRYQDENNYYRFEWNQESSTRRLVKCVSGSFSILAEDSAAYVTDQTYDLEVIADGDSLQVSIDDSEIFSVTDSTFSSGSIALYCHANAGAYFDDIAVTEDTSSTPTDPDLVGWWELDEISGDTVPDSANTNHGTRVGATWTTGKIGGALDFDGVDDYVIIPDHSSLSFGDNWNDEPFSISVWFYKDSEDYSAIISKCYETGSMEYVLRVNEDEQIGISLYDENSYHQKYARSANSAVTLGEWYHYAMTYDGSGDQSGLTLYLNGYDVTDTRGSAGSYTAMDDEASDLYLGAHLLNDPTWKKYCTGKIDDARIYSKQLSLQEVQDLCALGVSNQPPVITSVTASPSTISDTETSQLQVNANDPDSGPIALTYNWTIQSGEGTLNDYTIANPIYTPPNVSSAQMFTLTVEVSDGVDITSDNVDITVTDTIIPNQAPVITSLTASPSTISDIETSQLQVTANDPDSGPSALTYSWTVQSGEGTLNNYNIANPIYTPPNLSTNKIFTLTVEVSDGADITSCNIDITVTDATPLFDYLVSWWKFDEGIGGDALDSAGSNHGDIYGADWTTGVHGGALYFDGIEDDYVIIPDDSSLSFGNGTTDSPFSISVWVYYDGGTGLEQIFTKMDCTTGAEALEYYIVMGTADKYVAFSIYDESTFGIMRIYSPQNLLEGWHHIVATYDGESDAMAVGMNLYIDTVASTHRTDNGNYLAMENTATNVLIGAIYGFGGTIESDGQVIIDDTRIYNKELSAQEVQDLYNPDLPFSDNFSDGNYDGWILVDQGTTGGPMAWSAATNVMVQSSDTRAPGDSWLGTYAYLTGSTVWMNYKTRLTLKSTDDGAIGLMFRYQDQDNYYRFDWNNELGVCRIVKVVSGQFSILSERSRSYIPNQTYNFEVIAYGGSLEVSIDGSRVLSATDSSLSSGTIALYCCDNAGSYFDDIVVESKSMFNWAPVITSVTASPSEILDSGTSQLQVNATDPEYGPGALTYNWSVQPGEGSLSNPSIANPVYTPPDVSTTQIFTLTVEVSDGVNITSSTVDITVTNAVYVQFMLEDIGNGQIRIGYNTPNGEAPRSIALSVDLGSATVQGPSDVLSRDTAFNSFIDYAHSFPSGYTLGIGHPLASLSSPGVPDFGSGISTFAINMACFDEAGNQAFGPVSSSNLITLQLHGSGSTTITIDADTTRGCSYIEQAEIENLPLQLNVTLP